MILIITVVTVVVNSYDDSSHNVHYWCINMFEIFSSQRLLLSSTLWCDRFRLNSSLDDDGMMDTFLSLLSKFINFWRRKEPPVDKYIVQIWYYTITHFVDHLHSHLTLNPTVYPFVNILNAHPLFDLLSYKCKYIKSMNIVWK